MARGLGVGLYKKNSVLNILGPRTNMLYLLLCRVYSSKVYRSINWSDVNKNL